jgi:hypothetical protein
MQRAPHVCDRRESRRDRHCVGRAEMSRLQVGMFGTGREGEPDMAETS